MASVKFKLQKQQQLQFTAKKKKTYYGKCKIQTPKPATATIGNVPYCSPKNKRTHSSQS
jgi:hypothetical protein